jgi:CRISPR-associated protein Cas5d
MDYAPVAVKVWGDWACFTRPELKAERVSYPMMTPSAARGVLEAIFWKPEFHWRVRQIHVLRSAQPEQNRVPIGISEPPEFYRYFSIMRNEINSKATGTPISIADARTQRHTLALRNVAYLILADVEVRPDIQESPVKFRDQFRRRVERGRCFHRPYLGCREFAADFAPQDGTEDALRFRHADPIDLGLMLFDIARSPDGTNVPYFFQAELNDGVLDVPGVLYGRYGI